MSDMETKDLLSLIPDNLKDIYKKAQIVLSKVVADVEKESEKKKSLVSEIEKLNKRLEDAKRKTVNFEVEFEEKKAAAEKELAAFIKAEQEHVVSLKNELRTNNKELQDQLKDVAENNRRLKEGIQANEGLVETRDIMVADLTAILNDIKGRLDKYGL